MSEDNVEIAKRILEGTQEAEGNFGAAFDLGVETGLLAPDAVLVPARELRGGGTYRGKDGFTEFMRAWTEDFEDWTFELERAVDAGDDRVVLILRQRGPGRGSGVPVELRHGVVYEFENGRLKRLEFFLDPREALEAAGLSE